MTLPTIRTGARPLVSCLKKIRQDLSHGSIEEALRATSALALRFVVSVSPLSRAKGIEAGDARRRTAEKNSTRPQRERMLPTVG